MCKLIVSAILAATAVGCGGEFILTVPDAVSAAGADVPVTVRLQRHEFWRMTDALEDAALRMCVMAPGDDAPMSCQRAAYTHSDGYATALLPAIGAPGRYALSVCHQDTQGDEVCRTGRCYVLEPSRLAVVVDWEAVEDADDAREAAESLSRLAAGGVRILYAADDAAGEPDTAHAHLATAGLPDGPVLSWGRRRDWLGRERSVTGSLPTAKKRLAGLVVAVGVEDDFLRAAAELHLAAIEVSPDAAGWSDFADRVTGSPLMGEQDFSAVTADVVRQQLGR